MNKIKLFFFSIFLVITPVISMERQSDLQALPDPAAIIVVAFCENKNVLRQTCKRFCEFASRRKNEIILEQPQLYLTQEALDRYLLYYGALGNIAIVRNLLAKGANPNTCEDSGITLMHYAMQCGYEDIVNMLLEYPDLVTADFIKRVLLFPKMQCNQTILIERIFSHYAIKDEEALFYAVKNGLYTMLQDVSADVMNKSGTSLLHLAMEQGRIDIMKLFIRNGANVNEHNSWILHEAVRKRNTSAVQLLIDHGANFNAKAECGYTPLSIASSYYYLQIVKILLEKEVCVDEKDNWGNTSLHKVVENKFFGAAPDTEDVFVRVKIVEMLLEKRAQINATNNKGKTPMDRVTNEDIKNLLIVHGGKTSNEPIIVRDGKTSNESNECIIQ